MCSKLLQVTSNTYEKFLGSAGSQDGKITEKGALQMLFDLHFLSKLLQNSTASDPLKTVMNDVKAKVYISHPDEVGPQ